MKKNTFLSFAVFLLPVFFSCEKEPVQKEEEGNKFILNASLENGRNWKEKGVVLINGTTYTISGEAGTPNTTISGVAQASEYLAAYDYGEGILSDNLLSLELPKTVTPGENEMIPMVAYSDNSQLLFKNLLGFLNLKISGNVTITRLSLAANNPDQKLSGAAQADLYFVGNPKLVMDSSANPNISLDFGSEGLPLSSEGQTISIPLPPANYEDGFHLIIYDAEGNAMEKPLDFGIVVKRGEKKTLPEFGYVPGSEAPFEMECNLENDASGETASWASSDAVSVNGAVYDMISGDGTAAGKFGPVIRSESYTVISPAKAYYGHSANLAKVAIPSTQYFNTPLKIANPQVGITTGETVDLKYTAGVIAVNISGNNIVNELQLVSKDASRGISGKMDILFSGNEFTTSMINGAKKSIVLKCTGGVSVQGGKQFRFIVPEGEYPQGFRLIVTNNRQQMHDVETGAITVTRNQKTELENITWTPSADDSGNLSIYGWANSYIVSAEGKYTFDTKLVDGSPVKDIAKVDWLWANSVKGDARTLVSDIQYKNGQVTFNASAQEGNVILAAFNASGEIVWSWHIWLTDEPKTINTMNFLPKDPSLGYFVMDRNLGATSAAQADGEETYGFFYQWGRKDPFYGGTQSETILDSNGDITSNEPFKNAVKGTVCNDKYPQAKWQSAMGTKEQGTIDFSIKNPMFFLSGNITSGDNNWLEKEQPYRKNYDQDLAMWRPFEKTIYDPCPAGYQIPRKGAWDVLEPKTDGKWVPDFSGFIYTNSESGESTWFPAQGMRIAHPDGNGALSYIASGASNMIGVWTSEQMTANPSCRSFSLNINTVLTNSQAQDDAWGYGLNVRCVKIYEYHD